MERHDAHINAFTVHMVNKVLGGKSIYEHKKERTKRQLKLEMEWVEKYPQKGDRVVFRSVDSTGNIYDGYGLVEHIHVHEFSTGYALYTVKLEFGGEPDVYQLYCNRPGQEDKEWIRRA